jgi:hypothetical protein
MELDPAAGAGQQMGMINGNTPVWLMNRQTSDLRNAVLTRWSTYIRLLDFEARHVKYV